MNQKPRIPWKRCIENAIQDLKNRSIDGLVLSQISLEEADLSLPLVQVIEKRRSFWMQNKQYQLVADQVNEMSSQCVEYLILRMKEACEEIEPPPDPWNLLADYVGVLRPEELKSFADKVR